MSSKYRNPPIVEALCGYQFIPGQPWDFTIPALFYERVKDQFPEKKAQIQVGFPLEHKAQEAETELSVQISHRMQFLRADKKALVQIGPDLLVINHLKPYPTWDKFRELILKNLQIYQEIAKPKGFKRLGLRYINKIDFPAKSIQLEDYFTFYPFVGEALPQEHGPFYVRIEIPYEQGRDHLLLTFGTTMPEKPDTLSCMLDLDYVMGLPEKVPLAQATEWVEKAHKTIEEVFEACITDKCRNLFEEAK